VATLIISHKRKRWRHQPEALLGDKGYDTDFNSLEVRAIKAVRRPDAARQGKLRAVFSWRVALAWLK
jgi:hypothetical protein